MSIVIHERRTSRKAWTLRSLALAACAAAALVAVSAAPARAEDPRWHGYHGREWDHWRGGHWYHGWHDGRFAWWWLAGGIWSSYVAPVYPYPEPYAPPAAVVPGYRTAHYCYHPRGYYPYVASCAGPWRFVPPY